MVNVIIPECGQKSLDFYLGMEEFVACNVGEDAFFVWQTAPTVIIGRNQELDAEVNTDYCKDHDIRVYRRRSGGGCVYSDCGNIMISHISHRGEVTAVFDGYLSALTASLCALGLEAVYSERTDVLIGGRKVSGNAFQQLPGKSIVHGTLLYSTDFVMLENAIRPPVEKLLRHGVPSVRQRVGNLSDMLSPGWEAVASSSGFKGIDALKEYLVSTFCDGEIVLGSEDILRIEEIAKQYTRLV